MVNLKDGIFYAEGRIDTVTSGQFKEELKDAFNQESAVIDFSEVEYISSSGLRVILELMKKISNVSIINASVDVYEIFSVTGFTELINISKKLREISIEGCEIVGKGGTGTVYKVADDMIVKVFNPGTPLEMIETEKEFAKKSFVLGIPTAIPFDIVKVGDCYGTCFELLNAISLGKALQMYPERYDELVSKYVELVKTLQNVEDTQGKFENIKNVLIRRAEKLRGFLPDDIIDLVCEMTNCMPDSKTLVHGDLHTGNVMVQNDELLIIDMADMTTGPKNYDMLCLYRDFYSMLSNPQGKEMGEKLVDMPAQMGLDLWDKIIRMMYDTTDEEEIKKLMHNFELLTEVNTIAMSSLMPRAFLENIKPYIIAKFNAVVPANKEEIAAGFTNL